MSAVHSIRLIDTSTLAAMLDKDARTIARWCCTGDIEAHVRGTGRARRYCIIVRDNTVTVFGIKVTIESTP